MLLFFGLVLLLKDYRGLKRVNDITITTLYISVAFMLGFLSEISNKVFKVPFGVVAIPILILLFEFDVFTASVLSLGVCNVLAISDIYFATRENASFVKLTSYDWFLLIFSAIGASIGSLLMLFMNEGTIKKSIGIVILLYMIKIFSRLKRDHNENRWLYE